MYEILKYNGGQKVALFQVSNHTRVNYVPVKSGALWSLRLLKKYGGCRGERVTWNTRKFLHYSNIAALL